MTDVIFRAQKRHVFSQVGQGDGGPGLGWALEATGVLGREGAAPVLRLQLRELQTERWDGEVYFLGYQLSSCRPGSCWVNAFQGPLLQVEGRDL